MLRFGDGILYNCDKKGGTMRIFRKREEFEESSTEIEDLREIVQRAKMPEQVEKVALRELEKLSKTSPSSAEYTIGNNYIDYLVSLPWQAHGQDSCGWFFRRLPQGSYASGKT